MIVILYKKNPLYVMLKPLLHYAFLLVALSHKTQSYLRWAHLKLIYDQQASTYLNNEIHDISI